MDGGALLTPTLGPTRLAAGYRLVAELLLYPEDRDWTATGAYGAALAGHSAATSLLDAFLTSPRAHDLDEYLTLLELTPPCPLYLGHYLFEEPSSCRGAGVSGRNAYMLELAATYRHFGMEPSGKELADYVPLVAEFLALSLARPQLDGIGLRRRLLERHVAPALPEMRAALRKYESPYVKLVELLELLVADDIASSPGPAWEPTPLGTELPMLQAGHLTAARATAGGPANEEARR